MTEFKSWDDYDMACALNDFRVEFAILKYSMILAFPPWLAKLVFRKSPLDEEVLTVTRYSAGT